ncbi:MAG: amidohydrolase family protein, partial [Spongiibacteraceae bacterium]|nr:amidohydrolase family protein [Spongiibacteraceae bacterium]
MDFDLVIRNGTIVDGSGAEPFVGDVAVTDGKIVSVGAVSGRGAREIDASGLLVTPGFVDVHTHYDGQAIWSDRMLPSSAHGVTTAVMGNCGVGFAPCRQTDHDLLMKVMAGVEDIPNAVMAEGLPWTWETFPQYMDALDARARDIDVAAYLPHSPLRVYVMGERGANHETATAEDLERMQALARQAVEAGAIGFATSRLMIHRTSDGDTIPSYNVAETELLAIAEGVRQGGGGLLQAVPDIPADGSYAAILKPLVDVAASTGQPLTFTLATGNLGPSNWREALGLIEAANDAGGKVTAQVFPRPIGLIQSLNLSVNPFMHSPSYLAIAELPLPERVARMRDPAVKAAILGESGEIDHPFAAMIRNWNDIYPLGEVPNYEPAADDSIAARAAARGVSPELEAYEL